jgi:hypothetical protein
MTPKIIVLKDEGYKIKLAKAPTGEPKLKYRKEAERCVDQGKFTIPARKLLNRLRDELGLTSDEAEAIEDEVLQPYREHQRKFNEYEDTLAEALREENPFSERTCNDLKDYQKRLGLSDKDIKEIKTGLTSNKQAEYQNKLLRYDREFLKEVQGQQQPTSKTPGNLLASGLKTAFLVVAFGVAVRRSVAAALIVLVSLLFFVWGVFQILTAGDDERKVAAGRKAIFNSCIAFLLWLLSQNVDWTGLLKVVAG